MALPEVIRIIIFSKGNSFQKLTISTKKILNLCKKRKIKTFTYGYNSKDLKLITYYEQNNFQKIIINHKNKIFSYLIPTIGDFQVYNSLCAICLVFFSGIPIVKCLKEIKKNFTNSWQIRKYKNS